MDKYQSCIFRKAFGSDFEDEMDGFVSENDNEKHCYGKFNFNDDIIYVNGGGTYTEKFKAWSDNLLLYIDGISVTRDGGKTWTSLECKHGDGGSIYKYKYWYYDITLGAGTGINGVKFVISGGLADDYIMKVEYV